MSYAMQHFLTLRELQKAAFKALMAMPREASQELEAPQSGSESNKILSGALMMLKVSSCSCFFDFLSTCHCQAIFSGGGKSILLSANPLKLLG